jgi:integrase
MRRTRFQQGSLQLVDRSGGKKTWEYRWYELQSDGSRRRRNLMVGSLEQYPNETAAQKAVAALRADINAENPRTSLTPINVQTLIEHYREKELGPNCSKTRKTQVTYEGYFNKWILPRWGSYRVTDVKAVAVEQWLRSLQYANGSKAKARNIMSAVFNHAVRWEWLETNPIRIVRKIAKRTRIPIVLSIEQVAALLRILKEPTRTMVFVAIFTGLRVGELLGLKWSDIDLQKMVVHVVRSIVMQHVGDCKTEASRKPVPLDLRLAKVLWDWRLQSPYPTDEDWVFASPHSGGKLPYWPGSLYKAHLEPAAKEVGIVGHFGWHTFRHTYATLLKGNGEDVKVVQELMRHANISVTLNIYAQAITQSKRDAQSRVVSLLLNKNEEKSSTEAYRTLTDVQNSGGDLQVVDKVGVPDGI